MNTRNYLIVYINASQPAWSFNLETFLNNNCVPYLICRDLQTQIKKNILNLPMIELPNGEIINQAQFKKRFIEINELLQSLQTKNKKNASEVK